MKILQIIPNLHSGGAERFVCELSNELNTREDIECDILTLYKLDDNDSQLVSTLKGQINIKTLNKRSGFRVSMLFQLYNFLKKGDYDVVHVHLTAIKYIFLASILLQRRIRFVSTIHSEAKNEAGKTIDKYSRILLFNLGLCIPVTISRSSKLSFSNYYHLDSVLIENGVSEYTTKELISKKKDEIIFLHPASCQKIKNQELLFSAFKRLSKDYPNIKLLWMGNVHTHSELFKKLSKFLSDKIVYIGKVENVRDYMKSADAVCLSSLMEGMPMTIIEAFSVGCIPLVTPVGGCVDMIQNGFNGFLSDSLTVDDYYSMLHRFMLLSDSERKELRLHSLQSFEKYNIKRTADRYYSIFKK